MPKHKYTFRPKARQDALTIAVFIRQDNPKAAAEFLHQLEETCKNISTMPEIGSRRSYRHPALEDVRMLPVNRFNNYLIFYKFGGTCIDIIRIIHAARDLPTLFA